MTIPRLTPAKTLEELEANVSAVEYFQELQARVSESRRKVLAQPIPRSTCPGCFSAIYDDAAKAGWCGDCEPLRPSYERHP